MAPDRALFHAIVAWQRETFPKASVLGALAHLAKEWQELQQHPEDGAEMADMVFLLIQLAAVQGIDLYAEIERKFAINRARRWNAPDAAGVVEHVRA